MEPEIATIFALLYKGIAALPAGEQICPIIPTTPSEISFVAALVAISALQASSKAITSICLPRIPPLALYSSTTRLTALSVGKP